MSVREEEDQGGADQVEYNLEGQSKHIYPVTGGQDSG
jgi:hypothetical protein